jgi:hypothetical protein
MKPDGTRHPVLRPVPPHHMYHVCPGGVPPQRGLDDPHAVRGMQPRGARKSVPAIRRVAPRSVERERIREASTLNPNALTLTP